MVFESIVVDVLNRTIGDYIENMDKKQLNIGVWGGDVVLTNLKLKESALDELDLPIKTIYGHLGRLVLKIPWKNLYTQPVEAIIEDLYVLATPNQGVRYRADKEELALHEAKIAELAKYEAAKLKEAENVPTADKSFSEKLVAQIVNNIQIKISNIHIRFEDTTISKAPFSFGVTLSQLNVHTTDAFWNRSFVSQATTNIYKVAQLEGLAVYLNCNCPQFTKQDVHNYAKLFRDSIATKSEQPANFSYMLGPISSMAKLQLNTNPELETVPFSVPKVCLDLHMIKLAVGITRDQYQSVMRMVETADTMIKALPYRKYRPHGIAYRGHYKEWWHFAYKCIAEGEIRRKRREWAWNNMLCHRNMCRLYKEDYRTKLQTKKPPAAIVESVQKCEAKLDIFNLILIREQIKMDLEKLNKHEKEQAKKGGWFSSFWRTDAGSQSSVDGDQNIRSQFEAAMTNEEKAKLFKAIGYQENVAQTELPDTFVAMKLNFVLDLLEISVRDENLQMSLINISPEMLETLDRKRVVLLRLQDVTCHIDQRPAASAMRATVSMRELTISGVQQGEVTPILVKSSVESATNLLDIAFETNPIDKACDQRIDVSARPVQVTFDSFTIIQLVKVFENTSTVSLSQLRDAASEKLSNIKERSATGLQYILDKHTVIEIKVVLMPSCVIIPQGGLYIKDKTSAIIVNLGKFVFETEPRVGDYKNVTSMFLSGANNDQILEGVLTQCYDKYKLDIRDVQILFVNTDEDWRTALLTKTITEMHVLEPTSVALSAHLCVIDDDPRLPKTKIAGEMPYIGISVTDKRLLDAIGLLTTLPLPQSDDPESTLDKAKNAALRASAVSLKSLLNNDRAGKPKLQKSPAHEDPLSEEIVQYTNLIATFVMKEFSLTLYKSTQGTISNLPTPSSDYQTPTDDLDTFAVNQFAGAMENRVRIVAFKCLGLELDLVQKTYELDVSMKLRAVNMDQFIMRDNGEHILNLMSTGKVDNACDYLLNVHYLNANKTSPEFVTRYASTEQLIEINFCTLLLLLHQEGLIELLQIANDFQSRMEMISKLNATKDRIASTHDDGLLALAQNKLPIIVEDAEGGTTFIDGKKKVKRASIVESIQVRVIANLQQVSAVLATEHRQITSLKIQNLTSGVIVKTSYTEINVKLEDITINDPNPASRHARILSIVGGNALNCQLVIYNIDETSNYNSDNMKVTMTMGCVRLVFLNCFVQSVLCFLDHFQAAQQAIADASSKVAEAAKHNMVEAYTNATRLKLDIRIKAPIIIVPVDSASLQALSIDLGYLILTNFCHDIVTQSAYGNAVLDEIKLELNDVKILKVELCPADSGNPQDASCLDVCLLDPTSFTITVHRNLSASWFKERPELEISGHLASIVVNLTMDDYKMAMQITNRNLSEGADERRIIELSTQVNVGELDTQNDAASTPADSRLSGDDEAEHRKWIESAENATATQKDAKLSGAVVNTFLKFSFQMDSITMNLNTSPHEGLASFGVHYLSLKGNKMADGLLTASIVLLDAHLDDSRPNRENKITRFMTRREPSAEQGHSSKSLQDVPRSMFDITASMKENDLFAEVRIFSFDLIISIDFLMRLAKFFEMPESEVDTGERGKTAKQAALKSTGGDDLVKKTAADTESNSRMTIILSIEQPDIVLIEKMDDINCRALILNCDIGMRLRLIGQRQIIQGEIKELNLYMCEFNPAKRYLNRVYVLHPFSLSVNGSKNDEKGLAINFLVTDIKISISPAIIELLNRIMVTMTAVESTPKSDIAPVDYSNIWTVQSFEEDEFWFMKIEEGRDIVLYEVENAGNFTPELCIVEIPSIVLIIETGYGFFTIPMLQLETEMHAEIRNWSSELKIQSTLHLDMSYYNNTLALWEPIIEPVEKVNAKGLIEYEKWQLALQMGVEKTGESDLGDEDETKTVINVTSESTLEMTISKTCLDVLTNLGAAFSDAIKPTGIVPPDYLAPYVVQNDTGFDITLELDKGSFALHSTHLVQQDSADKGRDIEFLTNAVATSAALETIRSCRVLAGGRVFLQAKESSAKGGGTAAAAKEKKLHVQVGDITKTIELPVYRADKRYFPLYRDTNTEPWGIVSDVKVEYGCTVVNIHGVLQVHNHFTVPLYLSRNKGGILHEVGVIQADACFNVPLHAIYAIDKELHIAVEGYKPSVQGINWKDSPSDFNLIKYLQLDPITTFEPLNISAIRERIDVYHEVTSKVTMISACFIYHLRPPLLLRNALPIDVCVSVVGCSVKDETHGGELTGNVNQNTTDLLDYGEKVIKAGELVHMPTIRLGDKRNDQKSYIVAKLINYLDKDWSCMAEIPPNPSPFTVWTFNSYDSQELMSFELGVQYENKNGSLVATLYCPFWMINKTGEMLTYRTGDESINLLYHPPEHEGPILFSFREKAFFGKKKAAIRVDSGEWCERFSLDVAGSSGVVTCTSKSINYQIAVHNILTYNSLTKQIVFMPYYVMLNKAPFTIEVQESDRPADPWIKIEAGKCVPLWPKAELNRLLRVKTADDRSVTPPFKYTEVQCTLLKLHNRYGGINVDVHVTEGGVYITFCAYHPGDAAALVINHTGRAISFYEKGNVNERSLEAGKKMLYTWADPAGDRLIVWQNADRTHIENDLRRDGVGTFSLAGDETNAIYWVSFLDGTQRVLLFTEDVDIANDAQSTSHLDKVTQEINVSVHGIGVSLVNNVKHFDVIYMGVASSGVIWEERKRSRFKPTKIRDCQLIEEQYQTYLRDLVVHKTNAVTTGVGDNGKRYFIDGEKIEVNFTAMRLRKLSGNGGERDMRRVFYPGLWMQMKTSPFQSQFHAKLNRIQIDNQLADCVFPVILAPVPLPKSVAATIELKPFIEASIVQRIIPNSTVKQFKYLRMLIQEFHIKVDLGFINELFEMISRETSEEDAIKLFAIDVARITEPLSALVQTHSEQEQKNFYDNLHLGPIKIHVSFSMAGSENSNLPGILATLLQGVGVTLTDVNDVVFRLAFFEREYTFLTQRQLVGECSSHYTGQAVKQLYVLVLGLDVIGNPYGLVVGFTKGVEDLFYEPFQGAIQGPGEFAEGLVLGVRSLFGHTVGGAAGAVSKITGAMGKGLAALTFDKDYQKKRRDQLNKKPANLQEGIARSGKGLVMGVFDGVTGVFTKPISGAKSDGVEGFFKGLGKGAVGLVARPTAGVVDFASGSFLAVKRATDMSEDVMRLRPPRFLHSDGVVRPYSLREAEGNKLLRDLEKGKYAKTDTFAHLETIIEKRAVVVISNHRVIFCARNDLFGGWQIEWTHRWDEILTIRAVAAVGVELVLDAKEGKRMLGLFGSSENAKKIILIGCEGRRDYVAKLMNSLKHHQHD